MRLVKKFAYDSAQSLFDVVGHLGLLVGGLVKDEKVAQFKIQRFGQFDEGTDRWATFSARRISERCPFEKSVSR